MTTTQQQQKTTNETNETNETKKQLKTFNDKELIFISSLQTLKSHYTEKEILKANSDFKINIMGYNEKIINSNNVVEFKHNKENNKTTLTLNNDFVYKEISKVFNDIDLYKVKEYCLTQDLVLLMVFNKQVKTLLSDNKEFIISKL